MRGTGVDDPWTIVKSVAVAQKRQQTCHMTHSRPMTKKFKILDVSHQFVPALDLARVVNLRLATQQKPSGFGTGWNAINGHLE